MWGRRHTTSEHSEVSEYSEYTGGDCDRREINDTRTRIISLLTLGERNDFVVAGCDNDTLRVLRVHSHQPHLHDDVEQDEEEERSWGPAGGDGSSSSSSSDGSRLPVTSTTLSTTLSTVGCGEGGAPWALALCGDLIFAGLVSGRIQVWHGGSPPNV